MEIDFLGLISKHSSTQHNQKEQQHKYANSFAASGDEISLSLCTSSTSTPDCQKDFRKNTWKFHGEEIAPSCSSSSNSKFYTTLAFHNLENAPTITEQSFPVASTGPFRHPYSLTGLHYGLNTCKNGREHPASPATVTGLYSRNQDTLLLKPKNTIFTAGKSSMRPPSAELTRGGYIPTVAMARRATLARFLEKRAHRLTAKRTFLMGQLLETTSSEACDINSASCSKKMKHINRS